MTTLVAIIFKSEIGALNVLISFYLIQINQINDLNRMQQISDPLGKGDKGSFMTFWFSVLWTYDPFEDRSFNHQAFLLLGTVYSVCRPSLRADLTPVLHMHVPALLLCGWRGTLIFFFLKPRWFPAASKPQLGSTWSSCSGVTMRTLITETD